MIHLRHEMTNLFWSTYIHLTISILLCILEIFVEIDAHFPYMLFNLWMVCIEIILGMTAVTPL